MQSRYFVLTPCNPRRQGQQSNCATKVQPQSSGSYPHHSAQPAAVPFRRSAGVSTRLTSKASFALGRGRPKGYVTPCSTGPKAPARRSADTDDHRPKSIAGSTAHPATATRHWAVSRFIPATLAAALLRQAGSAKNDRFTPKLQDGLAEYLWRLAGFVSFKKGEISRHRFMENLARIWAGFPLHGGAVLLSRLVPAIKAGHFMERV